MAVLERMIYGNTLGEWAVALGVAVVVFLGARLLVRHLVRGIRSVVQRTKTELDDLVAELLGRTRAFFLLFLALYAGSLMLELPLALADLLHKAVVVAVFLQVAFWGNGAVVFLVRRYRQVEEDPATVTTLGAIEFVAKLVVWTVIVLLVLDNLGVDVTTLVAGLGVGSVAVALAVQNILADLFASLSIVLDKPFVIGDFIIVGDLMGTVEHVGLKTTRLRSLSGEQLVFSNSDLLNSRIRNFKRMYERRVVFSFGVVYQTPQEKLVRIPEMVQQIVEAQDKTRFDRAHFKQFGASSLDFEVVYYVLVPDYGVYMDIQQAINLALFRQFEEEGIEFAYPTQTLYLNVESTPALAG